MKKKIVLTLFLSLLISFSYYFGNLLYDKNLSNVLTLTNILKPLLIVPFTFIIFYLIVNLLNKITIKDTLKRRIDKYVLPISMIILLIAWIPALISNYPGIIESDFTLVYKEALGLTNLTSHHPLINVLFVYLSNLLSGGNPTITVLLCSIFQMIIMSFIFSYIINYVYKKNKVLSIILLVFFSSFQLISIYSIYLTKDVLFTGFLILFSLLIYDLLINNEFTKSKKILLVISTIMVSLLRSNGIIIIFLSLLIFILKNKRIRYLYILLIITILTFIVQYGFITVFNVEKTDFAESLGVPINQISYVVYNNRDINNKEREMIESVLSIDEIKSSYNKHYSDPIKFNKKFTSLQITQNKLEYLKLYIKLFIKYPKDYIESWMNLTIGYWYPFVEKGSISYNYEDRFSYYDSIGVKGYSKKETYKRYITIDVRKTRVEGLLWSPGIQAIVLLLLIIVSTLKNKKILYLFLPSVIGLLTILIATPSYCETRYVYYIFLINIIGLILILNKNNKIVKKV